MTDLDKLAEMVEWYEPNDSDRNNATEVLVLRLAPELIATAQMLREVALCGCKSPQMCSDSPWCAVCRARVVSDVLAVRLREMLGE